MINILDRLTIILLSYSFQIIFTAFVLANVVVPIVAILCIHFTASSLEKEKIKKEDEMINSITEYLNGRDKS